MNTSYNVQKTHVASNLISFVIMAICGLLLNIILVRSYGKETFGLFNQILAIFLVASQFSSFGIHQSVLSHIAVSEEKDDIFSSAFFLTGVIAFFIMILTYWIVLHITFFQVDYMFLSICASIFLFSLNKVMISALNGLGYLHRFATANAFRGLAMIGGLFLHLWLRLSKTSIGLVICFSEGMLFLLLFFHFIPYFRNPFSQTSRRWMNEHVLFGRYALFGGLIVDLNSKIDIILLSFFVTQTEIGIYSFASVLGEGFYQLVLMFRNMNAKHLAEQLQTGSLIRTVPKKIIFFILGIGFVSIVAYRPFAQFVTNDVDIVSKGFWIYATCALAIMVCSTCLLLDNIFLMLKKPKTDNLIRCVTLITNVVVTAILIPIFGIYGACLGLAAGICMNAIMLSILIRKRSIFSTE
jgi:O-antigen/teichoic acid export membrane protein